MMLLFSGKCDNTAGYNQIYFQLCAQCKCEIFLCCPPVPGSIALGFFVLPEHTIQMAAKLKTTLAITAQQMKMALLVMLNVSNLF